MAEQLGLPQIPKYDELSDEATDVELDGLSIRVCSLDHLLQMKRASQRPRDRHDVEELEAAREGEDSKD